jgi:hypothetical protein
MSQTAAFTRRGKEKRGVEERVAAALYLLHEEGRDARILTPRCTVIVMID